MAVWIGDAASIGTSEQVADVSSGAPGAGLDTGVVDVSQDDGLLIVLQSDTNPSATQWHIYLIADDGSQFEVGSTITNFAIYGWGVGAGGATALPGPLPSKIQVVADPAVGETVRVVIQGHTG